MYVSCRYRSLTTKQSAVESLFQLQLDFPMTCSYLPFRTDFNINHALQNCNKYLLVSVNKNGFRKDVHEMQVVIKIFLKERWKIGHVRLDRMIESLESKASLLLFCNTVTSEAPLGVLYFTEKSNFMIAKDRG